MRGAGRGTKARRGNFHALQSLDRHLAPELAVFVPVDRTHAALAETVGDLEVHERTANHDVADCILVSIRVIAMELNFAAIVDTPGRFKVARQVDAYLGLVPRESSSGKLLVALRPRLQFATSRGPRVCPQSRSSILDDPTRSAIKAFHQLYKKSDF